MSKGRKQIQTPMRRAINALYDLGYYGVWAPGDVLLAIATQYDVSVHELEGLHIDEVESAREADEAAERKADEAL